MARVFSLIMNKFKGKRGKSPNKVYNSVIYAFLTGLSGVLTSVFMKRIRSQVSNSVFVIY
jgi:hypothetical protein